MMTSKIKCDFYECLPGGDFFLQMSSISTEKRVWVLVKAWELLGSQDERAEEQISLGQ